MYAELQIRGVLRKIQKYFSYFSTKTYFDTSLELSWRDGSRKGSQDMFMEKYGKISLKYPITPFIRSPADENFNKLKLPKR